MGPPCTFAILKPDLVACPPLLAQALNRIRQASLKVKSAAYLNRIEPDRLKSLYKEHEGRFYYQRLLRHMGGGPVIVLQLQCENLSSDPVQVWRDLLGPSKFLKGGLVDPTTTAHPPQTLRRMFALSDVRNAAHGADSVESAARELAIFADQLAPVAPRDMDKWMELRCLDEEGNDQRC